MTRPSLRTRLRDTAFARRSPPACAVCHVPCAIYVSATVRCVMCPRRCVVLCVRDGALCDVPATVRTSAVTVAARGALCSSASSPKATPLVAFMTDPLLAREMSQVPLSRICKGGVTRGEARQGRGDG